MSNRKVFLLIGITGSGKSTTGNCIYNKSNELNLIKHSPFVTSDGARGCTTQFQHVGNNDFVILDTVGFGDPQFNNEDTALREFKNALLQVDNKIDCVIFVVKKGRFTNEIVRFFELVQENVLMNKCRSNSILLVTSCNKNWVDEQKNKSDEVKRAYDNCNGLHFEFNVRFDEEDDTEEDKTNNTVKRQRAINELVAFLNLQSFTKIDLSEVQTKEYEMNWHFGIIPLLAEIFKALLPKEVIDLANNVANHVKDQCKTM